MTTKYETSTTTLGWSDCGCRADHEWEQIAPGARRCVHCRLRDADPQSAIPCRAAPAHAYRPGTVLDPFAGTFTTGLVAEFHGRDAIGIDLNPANAALVAPRREEVRRALNPTHVQPIAGQTTLFEESA